MSIGQIPVLVPHFNGKQKYLLYCLQSAKKYNNEVVLLGDDSNKKLWKNHFNCSNILLDKYNTFLKYYKKMSFYTAEFETAFWKRIFLTEYWMKTTNKCKIILLDSDVITFSDYSKSISTYFSENSYAGVARVKNQDNYIWAASCHISYWTIESINDFIDFSIETYKGNNTLKLLEEKWKNHIDKNLPGGICEMTLLYFWSKDNNRVVNFCESENNFVFDDNINTSTNYENNEYLMKNGLKRIIFKHGKPKIQNLISGEDITLNCIHCQGGAKKLMFYFNNSIFKYFYSQARIFSKFHKIIDRFKTMISKGGK